MADDNRWGDRDREWREGRGRGSGNFGRGGQGGRGYAAQGGPDADQRWRQMHHDRRHEGAAGYNPAGGNQGGWEFGDQEQGGERGQGYERYGYGRGQGRPSASQGNYDQYGRDPGVGSAYGESWGADREYGRGGGQGPRGAGAQGGGWRGPQQQPREGRGGDYAYGAHTPYGYLGENEYDQRGRGGEYADDARSRGGEDRSWLERAGERVSQFFGAEGEGQHRGRGPKGYRRSDERIREDISDRLTDDPWLDASNIDVEVRECDVVLSGAVSSREDKRRAEALTEAISGVKNVSNNLRVEEQAADSGAFEGMRTQPGQTAMGEQATDTTSTRNGGAGRDQKGGATRLQAPDSAPGLNT